MRELDLYRSEMLAQIQSHAREMTSETEFEAIYDGYTFEASLGDDLTVELCPGGAQKALTRENSGEFVSLFLQQYTH